MMRLVFREKARSDLRDIMTWYREKIDGSEARFEVALEAELRYILEFPNGYQVRRPPFRFAIVGRFRYFVIYAVAGDVVVVHRIRHMHQRPLKRFFGPGG